MWQGYGVGVSTFISGDDRWQGGCRFSRRRAGLINHRNSSLHNACQGIERTTRSSITAASIAGACSRASTSVRCTGNTYISYRLSLRTTLGITLFASDCQWCFFCGAIENILSRTICTWGNCISFSDDNVGYNYRVGLGFCIRKVNDYKIANCWWLYCLTSRCKSWMKINELLPRAGIATILFWVWYVIVKAGDAYLDFNNLGRGRLHDSFEPIFHKTESAEYIQTAALTFVLNANNDALKRTTFHCASFWRIRFFSHLFKLTKKTITISRT